MSSLEYVNRVHEPGLGWIPAYQSSAIPFLLSGIEVPELSKDPYELQFYFVTRFIIITNTTPQTEASKPIRFGFSSDGIKGVTTNNYIVLDNGETFEAEFRVSKVFLLSDKESLGSASIVAGLTSISKDCLVDNWAGYPGVG